MIPLPKILIIDDHPRFTNSLKTLFQDKKWDVKTSNDAGESLALLSKTEFDLVLLDVVMPDMSGYQMMDCLDLDNTDTIFIIITGVTSVDSAVQALRHKAFDYIKKPFDPDELLKRVENALNWKQLKTTREKKVAKLSAAHNELEQLLQKRTDELVKTVEHLNKEFEDRKKTEKVLSLYKKKHSELIKNAPYFVYVLDPAGQFRFLGGAVENLLGFKASELLGKHFTSLVRPDDIDKVHWHFKERRTGVRATKGFEVCLNTKKSDKISFQVEYPSFELDAFGIYDTSSDKDNKFIGTYGVARDAGVAKLIKDKLIRSERLAATGQLASCIAHEINSPIQGISALIKMIKQSSQHDSELLENLDLLEDGFIRIRNTTKNLLDLNKPERDEKGIVDLNVIIEKTVALVGINLKRNRIELKLDLFPDIPPVNASAQQMGQVFLNLINNAVKAMSESSDKNQFSRWDNIGGVLKISSYIKEDRIFIDFADTGPGISDDEMGSIFNPFYTGGKEPGMGVGLYICKSIVENHQGTITVENLPEKGAVFTITLPVETQ